MNATQKRQAFLVIKQELDESSVPIEDMVRLVKSFDIQEDAEREAERLARIDAGKPWRYYWEEWTIETPTDQL